ncbi:type II toxin-antitoxin system RelB/DinJ family antitoxin [Levilactobacillus enshiensis]|uniref:type II toxin-antitoxin system RelB/DinJ family antitoxin n=1 Tax=Levilactobacillus enshiensis TaxID=2590213 RepID=UPI00117B4639|nr:type II toxin-antitoxin system RelB/DinJ family antitoxin [Levilactobacillus enshiensis]
MSNSSSKDKDRLTIRIDHDRKQRATVLAEAMGTDLPNLVNMFLAQLINDNGMPFRPTSGHSMPELDEVLADFKAGRVNVLTNVDDLLAYSRQLKGTSDD